MSYSVAEYIVLVDNSGKPIGRAEKTTAHTLNTPLHLAFSVYIFNEAGKFLITKRAATKKVWPDVWTNSCCGHPAPSESMHKAIERRLQYELGMTADKPKLLVADYCYETPPKSGVIEREFCPIYIAHATSPVQPNAVETAAYLWVDWDEYVIASQADQTDQWSWWCKDQLVHIRSHPLISSYRLPVVT
ncbi:MAG: isopentenyl-diphosphate Delta-isomerase [Candidatus Saccharimonadales bacterium]